MKRRIVLIGLSVLALALGGLLTGCGSQAKPPTASISSPQNNQSFEIGQTVAFKGTAEDSSGKAISGAKYSWNFGDGSQGNQADVNHSYKKSGSYTVVLTVRGPKESAGSTVKSEQTAQITVKIKSSPPSASAKATPTSGEAPLAVQFDGSASQVPNGTITKYEWAFGDGAKGSGAKVSHDYAKPGDYTATLTVTDNNGATAQATVKVEVKQAAVSLKPQARGKTWEIQLMTTADGDNDFDPGVVKVQPGDTLRFVLKSGVHTATAYCPKNSKKLGIPAAAADTSLCFNSGMLVKPGQSFEVKIPADAPQGTYAYFCVPHEALGMVGLIIVGQPSKLSQEFLGSLPGQAKAELQNDLKGNPAQGG